MDSREQIATLPVPELLVRCSQLIRQDRECLARLLEVLGEIDRRKVWAAKAFPSMFEFCKQTFNMSESTAAKRIWAARVVRKYPMALPMVRRGELHLTGIHRLARYLTPENHRVVLDRARNKSTRDIELLVAEIAPKPDVPARVRKLPVASTPSASNAVGPTLRQAERTRTEEASAPPASIPSDSAEKTYPENASRTDVVAGSISRTADCLHRHDIVRHNTVTPLAPARFKFQATIDARTREQLRQLQDLRSHGSATNRDLASILTDAIELLLTETLRKKAALPAGSTPRSKRSSKARHTQVSPARTRDARNQPQDTGRAAKPSNTSRREPSPAIRNRSASTRQRTPNGEARDENAPATSRASRKPSSRTIPENESRRPSADLTRRREQSPPPCAARSGSVTPAAAHSARTVGGAARQQLALNTTTKSPSPVGANTKPTTSVCAAAPTISTRPISTSDQPSWTGSVRHIPDN